jgi:hypothetical protein
MATAKEVVAIKVVSSLVKAAQLADERIVELARAGRPA